MGLDMYLYGQKYFWTNWEKPEENLTEDGFKVKEKNLEIGYWRKHPNLHGYITETFADGKDECQDIELSSDDIQKILIAIREKKLPETKGFFFGASDASYDAPSIEILEKALNWVLTREEGVSRSLIYRASW